MKQREKRNAYDVLQLAVDRRNDLEALYKSPHIQDWFRETERALTERMLAADPTNDEQRRGAALQVQVLRQLAAFLSGAIARGERAEEQLERVKHA